MKKAPENDNNLCITIKNLKGIKSAFLDLPVKNEIYAFVGENGSGKSTLLQAFAQLIRPQNALFTLKTNDYASDTVINFKGLGYEDNWVRAKNNKNWCNEIRTNRHPVRPNMSRPVFEKNNIKVYGMYEGSLFVGTRFSDSTTVDELVMSGKIDTAKVLVPADDYVIEKLSYILHGDKNHYKTLKRLKNRSMMENLGLKNLPYFVDSNQGGIMSQYRMSSGECLLVSLLHFIYNSIVRKSLPVNTPILMLLDEIELALHPSAVSRFLDLLDEIIKDYGHVSVFLTTHAPEVIKRIKPANMYKLENINGKIEYINPCYPSYAIRELYTHDRYDYLILCEDILTKKAVEHILKKEGLHKSKLIHVCPVGGWENVLKLHEDILHNRVVGNFTRIISVLDGDIEEECNKKEQYKDIKKLFLPIYSIEKCLFDKIYKQNDKDVKKRINDTLFQVNSLDTLIKEFDKTTKNVTDKKFYNFLKADLDTRKITEAEFIEDVLTILFECISTEKFAKNLTNMLS